MVLGSAGSNRNEYQGSSWGVKRVRPTTSPPSVSQLSRKYESFNISTLWVSMASYRDSFFYVTVIVVTFQNKNIIHGLVTAFFF
jgi:hypothetical protein